MERSFIHSARIFMQFMRRDCYIYAQEMHTNIINYGIIYPIKLGFFFAYLQKNIYFGPESVEKGTMLFVGSMIIPLLVIAYKVVAELVFDLEGNRFVDYQMTLLSPQLVLIQRIVFASLFTFVLTAPLFPIVKLFIGSHLATQNTSWIKLFAVIYASSLCCASYNMMAMCFLSIRQLRIFWSRINFPLMNLGGMWAPLATIATFSPILGKIAYLNPLLYVMEGIRQAALQSDEFLPFWLCMTMLIAFSLLFTVLSCHFFKKRVDHI